MKKTAILSVLVLGLFSVLAVAPAFADGNILYDNTVNGVSYQGNAYDGGTL